MYPVPQTSILWAVGKRLAAVLYLPGGGLPGGGGATAVVQGVHVRALLGTRYVIHGRYTPHPKAEHHTLPALHP